jgi:hypothetical protein
MGDRSLLFLDSLKISPLLVKIRRRDAGRGLHTCLKLDDLPGHALGNHRDAVEHSVGNRALVHGIVRRLGAADFKKNFPDFQELDGDGNELSLFGGRCPCLLHLDSVRSSARGRSGLIRHQRPPSSGLTTGRHLDIGVVANILPRYRLGGKGRWTVLGP